MKKIYLLSLLFPAILQAQTLTQNFVKTTTYKVPTSTVIASPTAAQAAVGITYFDALGRPIQQVASRQSASGNDIVTPFAYDGFGRQDRDYLAFPKTTATMAMDPSAPANAAAYYAATYGAAQGNAYSKKQLETSPLNRVLEQGAPGAEWAVDSLSDADHTIKYVYLANTAADAVRIFNGRVAWVEASGFYAPAAGAAVTTATYAAGLLSKTVTRDENWTSGTANSTEEYRNAEGQVVLKRTFNGTLPLDTYYAYDQFGNLSYVVPPLATGSITDAVLDGLCYQYRYDGRNRLVEKKIPGRQWEFIVYNQLDRVVATGPANSPFIDRTNTGWLVTKYDSFGRVVLTGWLEMSDVITSASRASIQAGFNAVSTELSSGDLVEIKTTTDTNINGVGFRYTSRAWPMGGYHVLTVNYYDNYSYTDAPTDFTTQVEGQYVYFNNTTKLPAGLPTGSWTRFLQTTSLYARELSYTLYDIKKRPIRNWMQNHLGGYTINDSRFDFAGKVTYTITSHRYKLTTLDGLTLRDSYTYTDQDRPLVHTHQLGTDGIPQLLSKNEYNEMGQLKSKRVGGTDVTGNTYLQKMDYSYNIRGWLKGINDYDQQGPADAVADLFAFKVNYGDNSTTAKVGELIVPRLYNGNISETFWRTSSDNVKRKYGYRYDSLNRLLSSVYQKPGVGVTNSYNESMDYDNNGNIRHLSRTGEYDDLSYALPIDNLTYEYDALQPNRLAKVSDAEANPNGFKDGTNTGADYTYDVRGNMTSDLNKGITSITYNHMDLPLKITFGTTGYIQYLYDAAGVKLQRMVSGRPLTSDNISGVYITDYMSGFQYLDGKLAFFPTSEGYVMTSPGKKNTVLYNYVFNYTDHLGNVRVSFGTDTAGNIRTIEENNYYPFGLRHENYNMSKLTYDENGMFVDAPVTGAFGAYKYKYNRKELQDELGLNLYDYGARNCDPALGRWMNIDPLAEKMRRYSPYTYALDSPVFFIDPDGMQATYNWTEHEKGNTGVYTDGDKNVSFEEALSQANSGASNSNSDGDPPKKEKPGLLKRFLMAFPVLGPTIESSDKLGEGDYLGSALSFGAGVMDLFTLGTANKYKTGTAGVIAGIEGVTAKEIGKYGGLSVAENYGIKSYSSLTTLIKGKGLQAHHLIEQRFASILGVSPGSMSSIAVTAEEHQIFTNAWRNAIGYKGGKAAINTTNATKNQIYQAAKEIYKDYPAILKSLGL